jgi:uncharacterized damage-inducible protein DinB
MPRHEGKWRLVGEHRILRQSVGFIHAEREMTLAEQLLPELDQEMATTRRLLERVPSEKGEWKPHAKSFPLGHLAQLVAMMPGWIATTVRETAIDLARGAGYSYERTDTLLALFDRNVAAAKAALQLASDSEMAVTWSLKRGEQVLWSTQRGAAVRSHINHLIHHRGQLTVYLRLLDVPLPSIYGPTADERW